ncbi:hypothetical protein GC173_09085 [bacterium]|nr:hypothetical protein [bacterium]
MYDKKDPRAALTPKCGSGPAPTGLVAEPQMGLFYQEDPAESGPNGKTWYTRGNNFVLAWTAGAQGGVFGRKDQPDEYVVLLPETGARITWKNEVVDVPGFSIAFVPPGDSSVELVGGGAMCRLFTINSRELIPLCTNSDAYSRDRVHIPDFKPWAEPPKGWKVRQYSLDVPKEEGRFGRIFRCTTFMVNYLEPNDGPRDPHNLSPHHHDDFEQCSLAVSGSFIHHLRWPWTIDMDDWRDDRADHVQSPSAYVIPPPVIHTTRAMEPGRNQLVDIFCPPRVDFSEKAGWVLNADDYPMPQSA